MKKYIFVLILPLIILITVPVFSFDTLYIGSFAPENEMIQDFIINLSELDYSQGGLILEFGSDYFVGEKGTIPLSRVIMLFRTQKVIANNSSLNINIGEIIKEASGFVIPTKIRLLPIDKPGIYENTLTIRSLGGEIIAKKRIIFEIKSWAIFELGNQKYMQISFSDPSSNKMKSSGAVILKLASNTNWELYGHINEKGEELADKLNIYTKRKIGEQYIKEGPVKINNKPKLISKGTQTVVRDSFWAEIDLFMEIEDITNIYSGYKEFPVVLYLNTKN